MDISALLENTFFAVSIHSDAPTNIVFNKYYVPGSAYKKNSFRAEDYVFSRVSDARILGREIIDFLYEENDNKNSLLETSLDEKFVYYETDILEESNHVPVLLFSSENDLYVNRSIYNPKMGGLFKPLLGAYSFFVRFSKEGDDKIKREIGMQVYNETKELLSEKFIQA